MNAKDRQGLRLMKHPIPASVIAAALVLAFTANAQASPIPADQVFWTYNWEPGAPAVFADGAKAAGVTFTNEPTHLAAGSSDIVATNLRVFSAALAAKPDVITKGNYSLTLKLSLKENSTVYTQSLTFTGSLTGAFSSENANVANLFTDGGPKVAFLGSYVFTTTLIAYTPPGPPDQSNAGSITASIIVENSLRPAGVPEPSGIVLSFAGLAMLAGAAWRKSRKSLAARA